MNQLISNSFLAKFHNIKNTIKFFAKDFLLKYSKINKLYIYS